MDLCHAWGLKVDKFNHLIAIFKLFVKECAKWTGNTPKKVQRLDYASVGYDAGERPAENNDVRSVLQLDAMGGRQGGIALVDSLDHFVSQVHEGLSGDGPAEGHRHAAIAALGDTANKGYLGQELDA